MLFYNGYRYNIANLDLAVLEDGGLPTIRDTIYDQTWLPSINGGAGVDTFLADYSSRSVPVTSRRRRATSLRRAPLGRANPLPSSCATSSD